MTEEKTAMDSVLYGKILCVAMLIVAFVSVRAQADILPVVHVAVVYDGPAALFNQNRSLLINEIKELASGEFDVRFDDAHIVDGHWDKDRIGQAVAGLIDNPDVDILLCLGVMASASIGSFDVIPKPVLASSVYAGQIGGRDSERSPRQANLNYIVSSGDFNRTLEHFLQFKTFSHLAVIVDRNVLSAVPGLESYYKKTGADMKVELDVVVAEGGAEVVLSKLPGTVDGVLVAPLLSYPEQEMDRLILGITQRKLPAFSLLGRSDVERGILAGLTYGAESSRLVRRIALNVQRILLGEHPEEFASSFSEQGKIVINMETARTIGFFPDWNVLDHADLLHENERNNLPRRGLSSVMAEVLAQNPDMEAGRKMVMSGVQDVNKARSYLIPKISVDSTGIIIDQNRAELSFGTESEKKWSGSVTATQVLFSEKAWSGWQALKHLQESKNQELETLKLNLSLDAAKAYMNVLRAQTFERILKNNLSLTEANLNRAKTRQTVGTAGASEVYRWQSEIAKKKKELLKAEAGVEQARNALNRILGKPLGHDFALEEVSISDPVLLISDDRFLPRVDTPEKLRIFSDFMVMEGLSASPELKRLDAAARSREQMVHSARRAYWLPDVVAQGQITDVFDRDGYSDVSEQRDKTAWSVAVNASFPLFSGGGKTADYVKSREELEKIRLEEKSATAKVEEGIRYMMQQAKASYLGIALSRDAAEAARKNLDLVTDAYARGIVSIIDLLDAQNASMMADLGADNAVYDFMIDMLGVQRSIGCMDYSTDIHAKDNFYQRLDAFTAQVKS